MIIYLEGNIGSGKSTLINFLQEYISKHKIDADVILEPVDEWEQTQDSRRSGLLREVSRQCVSGDRKASFQSPRNGTVHPGRNRMQRRSPTRAMGSQVRSRHAELNG